MDRDTDDIARGWAAIKSKYGGRVILAAVLVAIFAAAAGCKEYAEGYANRANATYDYVAALNLTA